MSHSVKNIKRWKIYYLPIKVNQIIVSNCNNSYTEKPLARDSIECYGNKLN